MSGETRKVWRAAPATLTVALVVTVAAVAAVLALAYLVYLRSGPAWVPITLGVLALAALVYTWRFGLHPRIRATDERLEVRNPFSRAAFDWDDITLVAPGENGLVIGSPDAVAEAWCVQKSNFALRRGRFTRADAVAHELIDLVEVHDPPLEDERTGLRIRRARPDESRVLTRIERSASEEHLEHLFPPEDHPYPVNDVTARWRRLLRDRAARVFVLDRDETPLGFVAFSGDQVLHLGVVPHGTRQGCGTALLGFATEEIFANGERSAQLWVLEGNEGARAFYRASGWRETDDRRPCRYPPRPTELRMTRANPSAPRRSR